MDGTLRSSEPRAARLRAAVRRRRVELALGGGGALVGICVGLVVARLLVPGLGLVATAATAVVPTLVHRRHLRTERRRRLQAWPDALGDLHTSMRTSASLHTALLGLAERGPEPLRPAFGTYRRLTAALSPHAALDAVRNELDDPVSAHVLDVLAVALDLGTGVVLDVLGDLAEATTAEIRLAEDLETAELETRIEARAASTLPFGILALLCVSVPGYASFYGSGGGTLVILVGAALTGVGLVAIDRLARHEVAR